MADVKIKYAASATITCSVASLGSSSTFVAGQESTVVDNTTTLYDDVLLAGRCTSNGTTNVTANTLILVYVFAILDDTPTYPDVMDGTDSAETLTSVGVGQGFLKLAAAMNVDAVTQSRAYDFGPVSIAQLFGGIMPNKWGIFVTHNTGQILHATAGNHFFKYTGVTYTVA